MDDQALIRSYGNTNLPEGTEDRPLVTFALFAYNQEKYIREAVEGAFSQTYTPLEIILSDDNSCDSTFEIMEEMAREYKGPHLVKVRKESANRGTLGHLVNAAKTAEGALMVVAAGDDVSNPNRCKALLETFRNSDADAIYSAADPMDGTAPIKPRHVFKCVITGKTLEYGLGATAAYNPEVFIRLPSPRNAILHEDVFLASLLQLRDRQPTWVEDALVSYRTDEDTTMGKQGIRSHFRLIKKHLYQRKKRLLVYINLLEYCRENLAELINLQAPTRQEEIGSLERRLTREISRHKTLSRIYTGGSVLQFLRLHNLRRSDIPEVIRLALGVSFFSAIKAAYLSAIR